MTTTATDRALEWLDTARDPRGLAAYRILFGALMVYAVVRFWSYGWIEEIYLAPDYHFSYLGFEWVQPLPGLWMYLHHGLMGLAAVGIMVGAFTRISAGLFFLLFSYAELIEKAAYLNHYYFVSLMALLLVLVPTSGCWSVDAHRRGHTRSAPRWAYLCLRLMVGIVYLYAGIAKLGGDWLLRAEPLRTWLQTSTDVPLVGPMLGEAWVAYFMCWAGAFYDLTIAGWLLWPPTRRLAYCASIFFHITVWLLFPIGVFSWVMLVNATLFFDSAWPRHLGRRVKIAEPLASGPPIRRSGLALAALFFSLQLLLPWRHLLYPGPVNWNEQGFRFSWRVMLIEKTGQLDYEIRTGDGKRFVIYPRSELSALQYRMLVTQPDMIHQYAIELGRRFEADGHRGVRVFANSWAALNGRTSQRMIDPEVDLYAEPRGLSNSSWIVPLKEP